MSIYQNFSRCIMAKRILAILLILSLTFCIFSCSSSDDEGPAVSEVINKNEIEDEDTNTPSDNQDPSDETPDDTNGGNSDDETDDETPDPPAGSGDYEVTYEYGYDNKVATSKTSGKVAEPDTNNKGYNLLGWFNGETQWDFDSDSATGDITLTAKWEPIEYKITYDLAGGTGSITAPTTYTVEDEIVIKDVPTNGDYMFAGWHMGDPESAAKEYKIPKGTTGDLTVYAWWKVKPILIGTFEQDNDKSATEPIEWIKLAEKDGLTLLVSKYALDVVPYKSSGQGSTWATSDIRKWCNSEFYSKAFSAAEKAAIVETTVPKAEGPFKDSPTVGCTDTQDKVFILSFEEYGQYLTSAELRKCKATEYVLNSSESFVHTNGVITWWLRNNHTIYSACIAEMDGSTLHTGYGQTINTICVRPAIWVDMSKLG